jgi:hypothetical protein
MKEFIVGLLHCYVYLGVIVAIFIKKTRARDEGLTPSGVKLYVRTPFILY